MAGKRLRGTSSNVLYKREPRVSNFAASVVRYLNSSPMDIAANMLGAPDMGSGARLHCDLYGMLEYADNLVKRCGTDGALRSRQAIAAIIVAWELANPNTKALGD